MDTDKYILVNVTKFKKGVALAISLLTIFIGMTCFGFAGYYVATNVDSPDNVTVGDVN